MRTPLMICALMASFSSFANCLSITENKEISGQFNHDKALCFTTHLQSQRYAELDVKGIQNLQLANQDGTHIRRLLKDVPVDGQQQKIRFLLPETANYQFIAQGEVGVQWHITLKTYPYQPSDKDAGIALTSPRLQMLAQDLTTSNIQLFWQQIQQEGTPLVEPYDNHNKRVTFLWQGAQSNVYLLGSPAGDHDPLTRLANSDIWYRSYIVPNDTLMQYKLAPDVPVIENATAAQQRRAILTTAQADPFNLHPSPSKADDRYNYFSLLSLDYPRECQLPDILDRTMNGNTSISRFHSEILNNDREIALYLPAQKMTTPRLLVLFDGQIYRQQYGIDRFFDKLIEEGKLPPIAILFVDSIDSDRRSVELPPNPDFHRFLADELLVWLEQEKGLQVAAKETIVSGSSYGGLASAWVAFNRPDRFGKVLSMSGSYWWAPENEAPEWLIRQYQQADKKPLQFFLEAGLFESREGAGGILNNNRQLKQVLQQRGYPVQSLEMASGHDYISWCEALYIGTKALTND
ncbi:alpha/beta hydrolase-fold protein [Proteus mirabilis]|uniref:alpha/beta hydrolase-fold protein n=1 Tax=Proteus mirabilis TaxID=584 RepID=UPI0025770FE8|nr:alpha/beta hydrolase-fold protein [Proteus mirabilis]MDM3615747.1 alpha/beta hydrolase-fold protein [Proteus mirabilis]